MDKDFISASNVENSNGKQQFDLAWDDFTSADYCAAKCIIFDKCSGNRERCIKKILANVLQTLTETEETVLKLRCGFYGGKHFTLVEVEECLGITREQVRRIEAKALRKLRHPGRSKLLLNSGAKSGNITSTEDFITETYKRLAHLDSEQKD